MKSQALTSEREKLMQVFKYLQALNQMRNPVVTKIDMQPWSFWLRNIPNHDCIEFLSEKRPLNTDADSSDQAAPAEDDLRGYFLNVKRPTLEECPNPPKELNEWLRDGWRNLDSMVEMVSSKEMADVDGAMLMVYFEDDSNRVAAYERWIEARNEWIERERPARQVMEIFEKLYALHNQMEREPEQVDLLLGDGILSCHLQAGAVVQHPVLLQRVELHFDASVPEFKLSETDHAPELYTALLRVIPELQASAVSELLTELSEAEYHPLNATDTSEYLKRLVTRISPRGELIDGPTSLINGRDPKITRDPLLFLRKRTLGFSVALERILEDLKEDRHLPDSILNLMGVETTFTGANGKIEGLMRSIDVNGEDERVLLSKEANAEQLQIALRLEENGAVLVQGPPGTGKTHTIANLLGHLLSQGKSVLVTSHTAKALRVLRDKVVRPLQPLCVSVLENDGESRKQMEHSVDAIAERLSSLDADTLDREAEMLTQQRSELLKNLRELRNTLQLARQDEYRPIVVGGESFEPSQAARRVRDEKEENSWIPTPVELEAPMPLSIGEAIELYSSNELLNPETEAELHLELPEPTHFLTPVAFERLTETRSRLCSLDLSYRSDLWNESRMEQTVAVLEGLLSQVASLVEFLKEDTPWRIAAMTAGKEGGVLRAAWEELIEEVQSVYDQSAQAQPYFLRHGFEVSSEIRFEEATRTVDEILQHLGAGGKLGGMKLFTKREWRQFIQNTKVDGQNPSEIEHFKTLRAWLRLHVNREKLKARWKRQMTDLGGPSTESLTERPEDTARQFILPIQQALDWYGTKWLSFRKALVEQGLNVDALLTEVPVVLASNAELARLRMMLTETLPTVVQVQIDRVNLAQVQRKYQVLKQTVNDALHLVPNSLTVQNIRHAVTEYDPETYKRAYDQLMELHALSNVARRREELLRKLSAVAPAWATAIRIRSGVHGLGQLPGDLDQAWTWRQLHDELDKRGKTSMEELQLRISDRSQKLREITATLVEKRAWSAQVRRTTLAQRQALQGWKLLVQKTGKGTGIRTPRLLAEARKLMPVCQTAVPVWIMPLSRVVENFVPGKNQFDVVIIDEASQADVMALTGLYFGNQVLVVGDDEQVSPDAVGQRAEDTQKLIDTYLTDVPNASIYDGKSSIYDLAKTSFPEVQLREHFRCVAPIIQFSNHLSYGGDIKPLRDASVVTRRPPTIAYRVQDAQSTDKLNQKEAHIVSSLLVAATEHEAYEDATFGVISLVGDDQAMLIDSLLRKHLSATAYQRRLIRCGNSAQFQGDERDVIFLSMVYGPAGNGPLRMLADPGNSMRKRFNVAASRARDQLWVVHSLDPHIDLKEGDLRRRLILHAEDPYQYDEAIEHMERRTESEFERQVLRRLTDAGYRVTPQWSVGYYRIDMVVEGGGKRLAVECDGDRWHPHEKLADDMARQAILERLGWNFVRIRGSQFFRNPDLAMGAVFERLNALNIPAVGLTDHAATEKDVSGAEIKAWIARRAAELRNEWFEYEKGQIESEVV